VSKIQFIPCTYSEWPRFAPYHYWPTKPLNKAARCSLVLIDGVEREFVASLCRWGKTHGAQAWLAHRTAVMLPKSHPAYLRLWAVISDAQAQQYMQQGLRFYSIAPSDHALYRDKEGSGWRTTASDSHKQKMGYRSHEYVPNPQPSETSPFAKLIAKQGAQ
jgi:hypothetical protein